MIGCTCNVCLSDDPKNKRLRCSVLIQSRAGNLLIDTPPDLRTQLLREKISLVHAVLFTHHHADHVFGLDDLRIFPKYLEKDLPVYCSRKVEDFIRTAFPYAFDALSQTYGAGGVPRLEFHTIDTRAIHVLGQTIQPVPLAHGRFDVHGFRIDGLAYCTDVNRIPDGSWELLTDLDVLILDALRFQPHPTHFSLDEALAVIEQLKPKKAYLTHLSCKLVPEEALKRLPEHVQLAYDGMRIAF